MGSREWRSGTPPVVAGAIADVADPGPVRSIQNFIQNGKGPGRVLLIADQLVSGGFNNHPSHLT